MCGGFCSVIMSRNSSLDFYILVIILKSEILDSKNFLFFRQNERVQTKERYIFLLELLDLYSERRFSTITPSSRISCPSGKVYVFPFIEDHDPLRTSLQTLPLSCPRLGFSLPRCWKGTLHLSVLLPIPLCVRVFKING